jgi:hypothetical protein
LNVYGCREWNRREQKNEDEAKFHVGGILAVGVAERYIRDSKEMTARLSTSGHVLVKTVQVKALWQRKTPRPGSAMRGSPERYSGLWFID